MMFIAMLFVMLFVGAMILLSLSGLALFVIGIVFFIIHFVRKHKSKGKGFLVASLIMIIVGIPLAAVFPSLLAINSVRQKVPEKITINKTKYLSGFYGDLYPHIVPHKNETHVSGFKKFSRVDYDKFDFFHAMIGEKSGGELYVKQSQWNEAKEFYSNGDNFVFSCYVGQEKRDLGAIDNAKFDELLAFVTDNWNTSPSLETIKGSYLVYYPDYCNSLPLNFYKTSKDNILISNRNNTFYIVDGKLLAVFSNNFDSPVQSIIVLTVPQPLAAYFIDIIGEV